MTDSTQTAIAREVVERLYQCIRDNRAEGFADFVAPSHIDHSNGRNGPAGFAIAASQLHQAYSAFEISLTAVVSEGDMVAVQWRERGVHTGPFFNLQPTHLPFEATRLNLYRLRDGLIVDSWTAVDPRTIRAQQAAQATLREAAGPH